MTLTTTNLPPEINRKHEISLKLDVFSWQLFNSQQKPTILPFSSYSLTKNTWFISTFSPKYLNFIHIQGSNLNDNIFTRFTKCDTKIKAFCPIPVCSKSRDQTSFNFNSRTKQSTTEIHAHTFYQTFLNFRTLKKRKRKRLPWLHRQRR